jgi:hypothetical protein
MFAALVAPLGSNRLGSQMRNIRGCVAGGAVGVSFGAEVSSGVDATGAGVGLVTGGAVGV